MMDWITRWGPLVLLAGLLMGLWGCGPTRWAIDQGTAKIIWKPAVVWKVNTGLYFYGGEESLLEITAKPSASGTVDPDDGDGEPPPS